MATRPYVPRADGEASIGISTKKWGNIFAYKIDEATSLGNNASLGYRQPSTAQSVGDIRYHATLPAGWYLECTTAGTTGSGALTITSPTVGGTVSDGTVTWTLRKNASTQDLTGYLPLSGGAMTSWETLRRDIDSSAFIIRGGTAYQHGAQLGLYGKDFGGVLSGAFNLGANSGSVAAELEGHVDGALLWNGNSLDKSAVVAESLGANGYRKYASGLIEQWGRTTITDAYLNQGVYVKLINLPISFSNNQYSVVLTRNSTEKIAGVSPIYNDSFNIVCESDMNNSSYYWFAIGY